MNKFRFHADNQTHIALRNTLVPLHFTPASSEWSQLFTPTGFDAQLRSELSDPLHLTLSRWIGREGLLPRSACFRGTASPLYPRYLQTTLASSSSQRSSHTVPYLLPMHTSTVPSVALVPFTNRIAPSTLHVSRSTQQRTLINGSTPYYVKQYEHVTLLAFMLC